MAGYRPPRPVLLARGCVGWKVFFPRLLSEAEVFTLKGAGAPESFSSEQNNFRLGESYWGKTLISKLILISKWANVVSSPAHSPFLSF